MVAIESNATPLRCYQIMENGTMRILTDFMAKSLSKLPITQF